MLNFHREKLKKPLLMGILNLTPDSFSDGGKHNTLKSALKRAHDLENEGADIIDLGGESTGPNSPIISLDEEIKRVIPILKEIRKQTKLPISVDTYKAEVAHLALEEGANIINDVTALRGDKKMPEIIEKYNCPLIMMYSKDKTPRTKISNKHYRNIISTIEKFFKKQLEYAGKHKIKNIIIDPGMGQFISNIPKYSFEIIARLAELKNLKRPILIGISRKSFLGNGSLQQRDERGKTAAAIAYFNGASIIRTHDIKGLKQYLCQ